MAQYAIDLPGTVHYHYQQATNLVRTKGNQQKEIIMAK
jgi:hypothetical protein